MLALAKQQATRNDYIQGAQNKDIGNRSPPVLSPRTGPMGEPGLVRIPKLTDPSIARIPKCARCRNHGIDCELKGHKEKCQFKNCSCRSCLVVVERQKVTATRVAHLRHQRKLAVKRGADTPDYRNRNPLTEEEELLLSRHLQNKTSDDPEYKRYKAIKNNDRYEHYSDVLPSYANTTKQCMLLREAQNAYSYFYGKCYYPDDKNERYPEQMSLYSREKHYDSKYYRDAVERHSPTSYTKPFKTICLREDDDYALEKYNNKCASRSVIAPRVVRLDENQYYREYFKSDKRDFYYEQKISLQNSPPPITKYDRGHVPNLPAPNNHHRHIEPLKVNNTMAKEIIPSREEIQKTYSHLSKRLEVLLVMFPEIKEDRLKEVLVQHNSDIQSTVQYLLKIKNSTVTSTSSSSSTSSADPTPPPHSAQSPRTFTSPHSMAVLSGSEPYPPPSHTEHTIHKIKEEAISKTEAIEGQELSAFTAVRRKCAR